MSVKITELPILDSLADNDIVAGVDVSGNVTSKIEMSTLKNYIDTNTQYTAGTNIDITNNVISAPDVYNKDEMDNQIEELQNEVDSLSTIFNAFPTESGEGESLTLDDTAEVTFKKFDLKGNTSQTGTPTPSSPIPVNVVSGDNEIYINNENLWCSDWEQGIIDAITGENATNNDCIRTKDYIPVIPNQHYAIKRNIYNLYTNVRGYDKNKNFLGNGGTVINYISGVSTANNPMNNNVSSCVIAPKDNVYYLRWNDFSNNLSTQFMMIKGDTIPTNYVPYNLSTYPINLPSGLELCKIGTYQDYFYKDSDKWYLHKEIGKYVITSFASKGGGNANILYYTSNITDILKPALANNLINTMSNSFTAKTAQQIYASNLIGVGVNTNGSLSCGFGASSSLTTLELANTWVASNNINVYYPLATPTNTEITYQPLIDQLNLLERAISYDSQTNISQVNNDLGFIIYAEAIKSLENVLDRLSLLE